MVATMQTQLKHHAQAKHPTYSKQQTQSTHIRTTYIKQRTKKYTTKKIHKPQYQVQPKSTTINPQTLIKTAI